MSIQSELETKYSKKMLPHVINEEYIEKYTHLGDEGELSAVLFTVISKHIQPIQNAISLISSQGYTWVEAIDIIDRWSSLGLFGVEVHDSGKLTIKSKIRQTQRVRDVIADMGVLPPILGNVRDWTNPYDGGYETIRHSAILGSGNQHDDYISLDALNKLQSIRWKLNKNVLSNYTDTTSYDKTQSMKVYADLNGKDFGFMWQGDKRGRLYCKGYDITFQGSEYHKALLDFNDGEVLTEEGSDGLLTAIAGAYGYDKELWSKRISLGHELFLERVTRGPHDSFIVDSEGAEEPILFTKYIRAYMDSLYGEEVFTPIGFDATGSGLQVMACLTGCIQTAKAVNLVKTGKRENVYNAVSTEMNKYLIGGDRVTAKLVKKSTMVHYYNSLAGPKEAFNEEQLKAFYEGLDGTFPGPEQFMKLVNDVWTDRDTYVWHLPDGHTAYIRTNVVETATINVTEDISFEYDYSEHKPCGNSRHLVANVNNCVIV
ncbi:MAG: hypothetical protein PF440_01470 [Thiomicrorhabdus sp.]|jgi:hypothetical protein|nr:hypothetical protein [Thiomicrorhabdus sp.]